MFKYLLGTAYRWVTMFHLWVSENHNTRSDKSGKAHCCITICTDLLGPSSSAHKTLPKFATFTANYARESGLHTILEEKTLQRGLEAITDRDAAPNKNMNNHKNSC